MPDKVHEIFDGILVYVFHEGFNGGFRDFQVSKFVNGVLMYSPSHSSCDGDKGVCLPTLILYGIN